MPFNPWQCVMETQLDRIIQEGCIFQIFFKKYAIGCYDSDLYCRGDFGWSSPSCRSHGHDTCSQYHQVNPLGQYDDLSAAGGVQGGVGEQRLIRHCLPPPPPQPHTS